MYKRQTANLLALVNGNPSPGNLKNTLEDASPYLSDAVLTAYFSKPSTPNGHIKNIHDQNKPVSNAVWQVLVNRNLPNGIMNNIIQQQTETTISDRTVLESELADAKFNVELAFADKVRYHLNDTLPSSQDSALNTIKLAGFADANCQLIAAQVASSNNTLTASIIDEMHGGVQNVDGFCKFQKMIIELNQSVQKCFVMKTDAGLKTSVESIANDKTADGYWKPTPPVFMAPVEPNWSSLRTFVLDSAQQFKVLPPTILLYGHQLSSSYIVILVRLKQ